MMIKDWFVGIYSLEGLWLNGEMPNGFVSEI